MKQVSSEEKCHSYEYCHLLGLDIIIIIVYIITKTLYKAKPRPLSHSLGNALSGLIGNLLNVAVPYVPTLIFNVMLSIGI